MKVTFRKITKTELQVTMEIRFYKKVSLIKEGNERVKSTNFIILVLSKTRDVEST